MDICTGDIDGSHSGVSLDFDEWLVLAWGIGENRCSLT